MTDNLNISVKSKKSYVEETFFLLNLLNNNACIRCINKSCKINEKHGIDFPEKMSTFVKNPCYITEIGKVINLSKNLCNPFILGFLYLLFLTFD
jgi:hypothetical protein